MYVGLCCIELEHGESPLRPWFLNAIGMRLRDMINSDGGLDGHLRRGAGRPYLLRETKFSVANGDKEK